MRRMTTNGQAEVLLALEHEVKQLVLRPFDADHHGAIRRKTIAFESDGAGVGGGHLQDVVIPLGLGLVLTGMNGPAIFAVAGTVAVKEGLSGAFIYETARDNDDALVVADRYRASLNHRLAGKVALGGYQRPGAVEGAMIARKDRGSEEESRPDGSCNSRG
jgi:hypothetical protein